MATVRYFTHNELLFQFDDSEALTSEQLIARTLAVANAVNEGLDEKLTVAPSANPEEDIARFQPPYVESKVEKFDATLEEVQAQDVQPPPPVASVRLRITNPVVGNNPTAGEIRAQQMRIVDFVAQAREHKDELASAFAFQFAAPNWILTGKQGTMPTGGPGGRPSPVLPSSRSRHFEKDGFDALLTVYDSVLQFFGVTKAIPQKLNVVVLDTAPSEVILNAAYQNFISNSLLQDLRPKLHVTRAKDLQITFPHSDPLPNKNTDPEYYRRYGGYQMPDHGMFVSGIIHELAPSATIYLVEVLNEYGMGTVHSIIRGVSAIESGKLNGPALTLDGDPLIINMSLCIDFDIEEAAPTEEAHPGIVERLELLNLLKWSLLPLLSPLNRLQGFPHDQDDPDGAIAGVKRTRNVVIVAAAGNEAAPDDMRDALYPAAYDGVIGVGALDRQGNRTWYSNLADTPPAVGVSVLGGDTVPPQRGATPSRLDSVSPSGQALLSLYVSPFFPDADGNTRPGEVNQQAVRFEDWDNRTGLAWWSGTSFATAIMSGLMASIAARGVFLGDKMLDAGDFINFIAWITGRTPFGEPKLSISQPED